MKRFIAIILFLTIAWFFTSPVFAQSNYVLPYPSYMPGSKLYQAKNIVDSILKYWYFGDFGQFDYNLKLSDRYLVEASTLFEYKQYLLGMVALKKSDEFFKKIESHLESAKKHSKDISEKKNIYESAKLKHIEVLDGMEKKSPAVFTWIPEKSGSTVLKLHEAIESSKKIRNK